MYLLIHVVSKTAFLQKVAKLPCRSNYGLDEKFSSVFWECNFLSMPQKFGLAVTMDVTPLMRFRWNMIEIFEFSMVDYIFTTFQA